MLGWPDRPLSCEPTLSLIHRLSCPFSSFNPSCLFFSLVFYNLSNPVPLCRPFLALHCIHKILLCLIFYGKLAVDFQDGLLCMLYILI